jgi:hypothetical protein
MKGLISISEAVGYTEVDGVMREVCATADASYLESQQRLTTELDSYLRTTDPLEPERRLSAPWLPPREAVNETVAAEEAVDVAKDIFKRWVQKVRRSVPALAFHA